MWFWPFYHNVTDSRQFNYQPTKPLTYISIKNTITFKIAPTCFNPLDHPQGVTFFLVKVILKTFTITEMN